MSEEFENEDLTPQERDAVQQMRNSGIPPGEVVKRAMANPGTAKKEDAPLTAKDVPQLLKQVELVTEGGIRKREFTDTVKDVVAGYEDLNNPTDLKQIQATAAEACSKHPDYAKWSYEETKAKLAEFTTAECDRRGGKAAKNTEKETAEARLAKEADAVDSGKGGGRSDPPKHETDDEDFDGSVCGTGDEKAFAMTDAELTQRYSVRAQKFLKKERGQKV